MLDFFNYTSFYKTLTSYVPEIYIWLSLFTFGIFFFAVFIWYFYKSLSKRDLFKLEIKKEGKFFSCLSYFLKYGILFPFYVCFWFVGLSFFMFFLAKTINIKSVLTVCIAFIAAIRVISYYKEELSQDLAKLLPFVLFTYFLTDPSFFSLNLLLSRFYQLLEFAKLIPRFLFYVIFIEWILRSLYLIKLGICSYIERRRKRIVWK